VVVTLAAKIAWGTFPDWIGGLRTAAATILVVWGLLREARLRRQDEEQRRREQDRQGLLTVQQCLLDLEDLFSKPNTSAQSPDRRTNTMIVLGSAWRAIQAHVAGLHNRCGWSQLWDVSSILTNIEVVEHSDHLDQSFVAGRPRPHGHLVLLARPR
jgi:hypothetical protein